MSEKQLSTKPQAGAVSTHLREKRMVGPVDVSLVSTSGKVPDGHLVALAEQIQHADETLRASVGGRLQIIVDQIRYLQEQARGILESTARDSDLHRAACNVVKKPNSIYHLYRRPETHEPYLSMIGPNEWGNTNAARKRGEFVGSYRLEHDQTWTPLEDIERRENREQMVQEFLGPSVLRNEDLHHICSKPLLMGAASGETFLEEIGVHETHDAEPSSSPVVHHVD